MESAQGVHVEILGLMGDASTPPRERDGAWGLRFRLSEAPPPGWVAAFDAAEEVRQYAPARRARIEGPLLRVVCRLDELKRSRFAELATDVAAANLDYARELLIERDAPADRADGGLEEAARDLGLPVVHEDAAPLPIPPRAG